MDSKCCISCISPEAIYPVMRSASSGKGQRLATCEANTRKSAIESSCRTLSGTQCYDPYYGPDEGSRVKQLGAYDSGGLNN